MEFQPIGIYSLLFSITLPLEEGHLIKLVQTAPREQACSSAHGGAGTSICSTMGMEDISVWNEDLEPFLSHSELLRKHL